MDSQTFGSVVRRLRELAAPAQDADLVRAFAEDRDSAAFAEVVRRHGPMVLGVCRRVLGDSLDADDAFQATFLVFIRRAGTLRQADRLAGWLHQVALRTARKLRAMRAARRGREVPLVDVPAGESTADFVWRELRPIFDEELSRLPDRLRLPAVLCFLEGCSKAEASRRLGWPEGTLSGRLQRAREWLRERFTARGLSLSSGALAVALFDAVSAAAVSERLIESTLQQAMLKPAVSAGVRALADGVTHAMFLSKVKTVAASVLVVGAIGTGTGTVFLPNGDASQIVASEPGKGAAPKKEAPKEDGLDTFLNSLNTKTNLNDVIDVWSNDQRTRLALRIKLLRGEADREAELVRKGLLPKEASRSKELGEEIAKAEGELKKLGGEPVNIEEKRILQAELETLKDRLAYEEKMVKKGFLPESAPLKTKREITRLEEALAKLVAPKGPDPRRAAMEALIQKMEEIVANTADGVKKGVIPKQELLNAEQRVLEYKFKLLELEGKADSKPRVVNARMIEAMKATVQKLEEIVKQTEAGVQRGIVPVSELLNSQATLARYQFELAQLMAEAPADGTADVKDATTIERKRAAVKQKETELARAEQLAKQKLISLEELRRLRIDLARLRAELATAEGDHASAMQHREAVIKEYEVMLIDVQKLYEAKVASSQDLRNAQAALAEAKIELMQTGIRKQLAELVAIREQEARAVKALFDAKTASVEELHKAERALAEAKLRLAEGR